MSRAGAVVATDDAHDARTVHHAAMRQGRYSPAIWKECTGMSVQELWTQYVASVTNAAATVAPNTSTANPAN